MECRLRLDVGEIRDVSDDKALKAAFALSSAMAKIEGETIKGFDRRDADIDTTRKNV